MDFPAGKPSLNVSEDPMVEAVLKRPSIHQHYAIHPKLSDPMSYQVKACKDVFYTHGWDLFDMIKYGFHGSIAGILLGVGVNENFSRKDSAFSSWKNTYAGSKSLSSAFSVAFKRVSPWGVGGAIVGCAWYVWFDYLLSKKRSNMSYTVYGFGYSLFGGVLAATAVHPRYFFYGFWAGLAIGSFAYMSTVYKYSNGKNQVGFTYEIPNTLSEEERKLWRQKDQIFELGQVYELKANGLKDL